MTVTGRRNAHLTYLGNSQAGRHGWLRLTPAYSVRLVREHLAELDPDAVVTDPFSGTGTTVLAAAELGRRGQALDINPFLVWLAAAKTRAYHPDVLGHATAQATDRVAEARRRRSGEHWQPKLANIERWWSPAALEALAALRSALDDLPVGPGRDLLDLGFCRVLIETSSAAFNHQSMSFHRSHDETTVEQVLDRFVARTAEIAASAATPLPGQATVQQHDARDLDSATIEPCDLLFTSPPYVNRMSYVRELRPYLYWLRFLDEPGAAADLDWHAIGGTWGTATSRLATWRTTDTVPVERELAEVCRAIGRGPSGGLLAAYVRKYFTDVWSHVQAAYKQVRSGGRAVYIVGNSTFYGHLVPTEQWYRSLLLEAGFTEVEVQTIRKRNSKRELFEFAVTAHRP
ncbi:MAG: DNA methyltransferase [Micromonosporaceae bacterium]